MREDLCRCGRLQLLLDEPHSKLLRLFRTQDVRKPIDSHRIWLHGLRRSRAHETGMKAPGTTDSSEFNAPYVTHLSYVRVNVLTIFIIV